MRVDESGDGWSAKTDFEKHTHADLLSMVANAKPQIVLGVGNSLNDASQHIQSLADDLATHVNGLQWESESGDTFKTWARQVVSATDTLAIFTSNTSVAITMAGQTLSSTKLPEIPAGPQATVNKYLGQLTAVKVVGADGSEKVPQPFLSPTPIVGTAPVLGGQVTQHDAYLAQTQLDAAHQEAIGQMEKLGGSYVGANQTLGVSTVPDFPPTPKALMPPPGSGYQSHSSAVNQGSGGDGGVGGGTVTVGKSKGVREPTGGSGGSEGTITPVQGPEPEPGSGPGKGGSSGSTGTTIQGTSGPQSPTEPTGSSGGGSTGTTGGGGGGGGVLPPGTGGSSTGTGGQGGDGGVSGGGGTTTTRPGTGTGGGTGEGGTAGGSGGGGAGGESGIHGGMQPSSGSGGGGRLGTGKAIGAEGGAEASALGRGGSGEAGGLAGSGSMGSMAERAGSGLETGAAAGERAPASGEAGGSGMMPMGGGGMGSSGGRRGGRKRGRAAYLVEDEETWTQAHAPTNPAVIK